MSAYMIVFTFGIAVTSGSYSKQMTLHVDLDVSKVTSNIWRNAEHLCQISRILDFYLPRNLDERH